MNCYNGVISVRLQISIFTFVHVIYTISYNAAMDVCMAALVALCPQCVATTTV